MDDLRTCSKCDEIKNITLFHSYRRKETLRYSYTCLDCHRARDRELSSRLERRVKKRAYSKEYWRNNREYFDNYLEENREKINEYTRKRGAAYRLKTKEMMAEKKAKPCLDCKGEFPAVAMDYDHLDRDSKLTEIARMTKTSVSWKTMENEISKCELVCANCHRLRTYHGDKSTKTRRFRWHKSILDQLKSTTPCTDCKKSYQPSQMDFDHINPEIKTSNIARLVEGTTEKLVLEIAKCQLVCANCHRIRSAGLISRPQEDLSTFLVEKFNQILEKTPYPKDDRYAEFPWAHLVGTVPDMKIAEEYNVSYDMVGWLRRKQDIPPPPREVLEWYTIAGKMTDRALAEKFEICSRTVWLYRKKNNIPRFRVSGSGR